MDGPNTGFKTMSARNKFSFEAVSSGNYSESSFLALVTSNNSCGVCVFHTVFVCNVLSGPALMPSLWQVDGVASEKEYFRTGCRSVNTPVKPTYLFWDQVVSNWIVFIKECSGWRRRTQYRTGWPKQASLQVITRGEHYNKILGPHWDISLGLFTFKGLTFSSWDSLLWMWIMLERILYWRENPHRQPLRAIQKLRHYSQ